MKKFLLCLLTFLLTGFLFATNWKSIDLAKGKRIEHFIEKNEIPIVYSNNGNSFYLNEENGNWIFTYEYGTEEEKSNSVYYFAYAYIDGVFDTFVRYGARVDKSKNTYMYAYISEDTIRIKTDAAEGNGVYYTWSNPENIFADLFISRLNVYTGLEQYVEEFEVDLPEEIVEKYHHFIDWYSVNRNDKNIVKNLQKEYKTYMKDVLGITVR